MDMQSMWPYYSSLQDTRVDNGGAGLILDLAVVTASGLKGRDKVQGVSVNLAENDVAAVQPRGDDSGDEKLGAVAISIAN
jgi:hypothetical protein